VASTSDAKTGESVKNDGIKSLLNILNNEEMEEEQSDDILNHKFICVKMMGVHREVYLMHLRQFFQEVSAHGTLFWKKYEW